MIENIDHEAVRGEANRLQEKHEALYTANADARALATILSDIAVQLARQNELLYEIAYTQQLGR